MQLILLLQKTEYNNDTDEYFKKDTKFSLPSKYSMSFSGSDYEVVLNKDSSRKIYR